MFQDRNIKLIIYVTLIIYQNNFDIFFTLEKIYLLIDQKLIINKFKIKI